MLCSVSYAVLFTGKLTTALNRSTCDALKMQPDKKTKLALTTITLLAKNASLQTSVNFVLKAGTSAVLFTCFP